MESERDDQSSDYSVSLVEIADRLAIQDCLAAYSEAIDRRDDALLGSLFEPGARIRYGVFDGTIEDLLAHRSVRSPLLITHHHIGNIRVRLDGGGGARSIAYLNVVHRADHGDGLVDELIRARYLDRWAERDRKWRFVERTLVFDWSRVEPAAGVPTWWDSIGAHVLTGNGPADPACGFLD